MNQSITLKDRAELEYLKSELDAVDQYLKNIDWKGGIDLTIHDGGHVSVAKRGKTPGAVVKAGTR